MAKNISTSGIHPTASLPRHTIVQRLESAAVDIETGLGIIGKLVKCEDSEGQGDRVSYILNAIHRDIDELHKGLLTLRRGETEGGA